MKKVYQIVDRYGKYRSRTTICGEEVDFVSKEFKEALVYTLDEANALVKYYNEEKNIPVKVETRFVISKKFI